MAWVLWCRMHNPPANNLVRTPVNDYATEAEYNEASSRTVHNIILAKNTPVNSAKVELKPNSFMIVYGESKTVISYECFTSGHYPTG